MNNVIINTKTFEDYLDCKYKLYLKLLDKKSSYSEFINFQNQLNKKYLVQAIKKLQNNFLKKETSYTPILTYSTLQNEKSLILNTTIKIDNFEASFDALKQNKSKYEQDYYEPLLICRHQNIKKLDKLLLAFKAMVLGKLQGEIPKRGQIIFGPNFSSTSLYIDTHLENVRKIIEDINCLYKADQNPQLFLNSHCDICEFEEFCRYKAKSEDNMSQLRGMSIPEIKKMNQKGIFTLHQLSYTFRPRKKPKRAKKSEDRHYFSLQALSLRENKIHIHGTPQIVSSKISIYFDIEGLPDRNFYYLIGLIIDNGNFISYSSF